MIRADLRQNSSNIDFLVKTVDKSAFVRYNDSMKIPLLFSDYTADQKRNIFLRHIAYFAAIGALALFGCPFLRILHIPCPCCGVTRAWLTFFRGDVKTAFAYHALFPVLPFFLWLCLHRDARFVKKLIDTRGRKILDAALIGFAILLAANHVFRMTLGKELGLFQLFWR